VIYPQGVWYTVRTEQDVLEILDRHIGRGEIVERLLMAPHRAQRPAPGQAPSSP